MKDFFDYKIVSLAREKYRELYREEEELNARFNTFVRNYKAAYEGWNSREYQILNSGMGLKSSSDKRKLLLV